MSWKSIAENGADQYRIAESHYNEKGEVFLVITNPLSLVSWTEDGRDGKDVLIKTLKTMYDEHSSEWGDIDF